MNFNELLDELDKIKITSNLSGLKASIEEDHKKLFDYDLAKIPYRYQFLPEEFFNNIHFPENENVLSFDDNREKYFLSRELLDPLEHLHEILKLNRLNIHKALAFPTRPFNLTELYLIDNSLLSNKKPDILKYLVSIFRGYIISNKMPYWDKNSDNGDVLVLYKKDPIDKVKIAVTSFEIKEETYVTSVKRKEDTDTSRYNRITNLLNEIIKCDVKPDYVILPELSIPASWFISFSKRLQKKGINLICGVEYIHSNQGAERSCPVDVQDCEYTNENKRVVHNQVWSALNHNGLDFPSYIITKQDKIRPAYGEEDELRNLEGLEMIPEKSWELPPIIHHGEYFFSQLICSQLTNIKYRSYLRGKVDALFIPEWNKDLNSFNPLVESAALDIHAYIIQCNNRLYGDSRIRAPFKDEWKRDVVRVKGGCNDYFVIGEIDIEALKKYQSNFRPGKKNFKPFPDGFRDDLDPKRVRPKK